MTGTVNVLFVIDTLEVGGAEKSLLELLPRFTSVRPVMCHLYKGEFLKSDYEDAGIDVVSLNLEGKYQFFSAVSRLRAVIRDVKPDVVHSTLFRSNVVARIAASLERLPVINSFVSDSYVRNRWTAMNYTQRFKHYGILWLDRITAPLVTRFTANSMAVKLTNCRHLGVPWDKVQVIYRGRDAHLFLPGGGEPDRSLRSAVLDVPSAAFVLVSVGRLYQNKGHGELISAFKLLTQTVEDAHLFIVGDGPDRKRLQARILELGLSDTIQLTGTRTDIPQILKCADLFVSASHYEGMPGAVIEAMLCGLPVLLSDIDVHREMLGAGNLESLFATGKAEALAEAILKLANNPATRVALGVESRRRAREVFDINTVAKQQEQFYQQLVGHAF